MFHPKILAAGVKAGESPPSCVTVAQANEDAETGGYIIGSAETNVAYANRIEATGNHAECCAVEFFISTIEGVPNIDIEFYILDDAGDNTPGGVIGGVLGVINESACVPGWNKCLLDSPFSLVQGTTYYLGILRKGFSGSDYLRYSYNNIATPLRGIYFSSSINGPWEVKAENLNFLHRIYV